MPRITKIIHMPSNYSNRHGVKTEKVEAKRAIDVNGKQKKDFVFSLLAQLEQNGLGKEDLLELEKAGQSDDNRKIK